MKSRLSVVEQSHPDRVLVLVTNIAAIPALLDAVRTRASSTAPVIFHLLVGNPGAAELTSAKRALHVAEAETILSLSLPVFESVANAYIQGSVSIRNDPMSAIEDVSRDMRFDEVILSTTPHRLARLLHVDLVRRLAHHGLRVTDVSARRQDDRGPALRAL